MITVYVAFVGVDGRPVVVVVAAAPASSATCCSSIVGGHLRIRGGLRERDSICVRTITYVDHIRHTRLNLPRFHLLMHSQMVRILAFRSNFIS